MKVSRRIGAALAVVTAVLASACALFSQRPTTHRYLLPAPKAAVSIPANFNVRVRSVSAIGPFEDTGIAYQTSAYQLDSYQYHRWVAPPTEMVADALNAIIKPRADAAAGAQGQELMMLDARVNAFQQVNYAGRRGGLVTIEFCLSSDKPLAPCGWRRTLSRESAAASDTPVAAVEALGAAYDRVLTEFAADLTQYLAGLKVRRAAAFIPVSEVCRGMTSPVAADTSAAANWERSSRDLRRQIACG